MNARCFVLLNRWVDTVCVCAGSLSLSAVHCRHLIGFTRTMLTRWFSVRDAS